MKKRYVEIDIRIINVPVDDVLSTSGGNTPASTTEKDDGLWSNVY